MTDPQVPANPANCCSGKKSVPDVQTRPTHTSKARTQRDSQVCYLTHFTSVHPFGTWSHTHILEWKTPAHTDSQAWAEKNAHIQKHPREGYSKWTSQPSKALTSIRHAYTVRLPTDCESHLSARASAKQFQSEGNHFMHICIHSERACQTRWLYSRSSLLVLFTAIVWIVKWFALIEWLFLVMIISLYNQLLHSWAPPPHEPHGKRGPMKPGQYDSQKSFETLPPSDKWPITPAEKSYHTKRLNITAADTAGTDCTPLCFDPLHICDRAHEARMHKFFMTISVSPCREPKTVSSTYYEKKNKWGQECTRANWRCEPSAGQHN